MGHPLVTLWTEEIWLLQSTCQTILAQDTQMDRSTNVCESLRLVVESTLSADLEEKSTIYVLFHRAAQVATSLFVKSVSS